MIPPRIGTRLDGHKAVESVLVGERSSRAGEVRIERRGVVVLRVRISSRRIRLPNLDQAIRHGVPIAIDHPAAHDDALPQRLSCMLNREILIDRTNIGMAKDWPGDFGKSMRQENQRLRWRPQPRRPIRWIERVGLRPRFMSPEGDD